RVPGRRPADLPLGHVVTTQSQVHQSEIRVAQRLIGRERDDLRERRFRLGELLAPQVREAERPRGEDRGIALEAPAGRLAPPPAAAGKKQRAGDGETLQGRGSDGGWQQRYVLSGVQGHEVWVRA